MPAMTVEMRGQPMELIPFPVSSLLDLFIYYI